MTKELGWRSVARMRQEMSSEEFMKWRVYYGIQAQRNELARG